MFVNTNSPIALNNKLISLASTIFPTIMLQIPTGANLQKIVKSSEPDNFVILLWISYDIASCVGRNFRLQYFLP